MDAAFEWLLQRPGEEETHAEKGSMEASRPHTTQINEDEYAFSLMDIASSTALGAGTAGKEIIDSPGTVRIISALRGRGRVSSDLLSAGLDPTEEEEEEEALSDREPVSGVEETRSQRSVAFRPMLEERNPMLEELQRCHAMDTNIRYLLITTSSSACSLQLYHVHVYVGCGTS